MQSDRVYLTRFRIRTYRNCRDAVFSPSEALSTLIGLNGAGKTTLLHGIQLLHKVATSRPRYSRSGSATHKCSIEASFRVCTGLRAQGIHYKAKIGYSLDDKNQDEISYSDQYWKLDTDRDAEDWIALPPEWLEFRRDPKSLSPRIHYYYDSAEFRRSNEQRYFTYDRIRRNYDAKLVKKWDAIMPYAAAVIGLLVDVKYYGATQFTNPELCPASIEIEDERVRSRGFLTAGHQRFLHDLYLANKRADKNYKQFEALVGRETLGLVHKITFKEFDFPTNQYEVQSGGRILKREGHRQLVIPFFHYGKLKLSPNQLSEGTLKTIALIFYLTTDRSRILLVEEPEVGIHHGLLKSIIGIIKDFSAEKQIILTTHSDFILDSLEPSNVYLVESPGARGVKVRSLPEKLSARNFAALRDFLTTTGGLGEYIRSGGVSDAI